jgi:hypothetical protein
MKFDWRRRRWFQGFFLSGRKDFSRRTVCQRAGRLRMGTMIPGEAAPDIVWKASFLLRAEAGTVGFGTDAPMIFDNLMITIAELRRAIQCSDVRASAG